MAEAKQKSKIGPILFGAVVLAAAAGGYWYWEQSQQWESTDDAQIEGRVFAVSPKVGGTAITVNLKDNQTVKAGDVLVVIDPRDYQVAYDEAKANLAQAEADLAESRVGVPIISTTSSNQVSSAQAAVEEARAGIDTAQRQVEAAQSRLATIQALIRQAQANHDRTTKDLERYRTLVAKEQISRQQFDTASTTADAAQAQVEATQAQLEEAKQAIRVAQNQVVQQQARFARAQAELRTVSTGPQQVQASEAKASAAAARVMARRADLERAKLNLEYTVIKAPVDGIVGQKNVEAGEVLQPGQPLVSIVPLEDIWVVANLKESQLDRVKVGQRAEVSVDAFSKVTYTAHVDSISAATGARFSLLPPENATGNYVKVVQRVPVKIVFDPGQHPERVLRPGMSVVPHIVIQR